MVVSRSLPRHDYGIDLNLYLWGVNNMCRVSSYNDCENFIGFAPRFAHYQMSKIVFDLSPPALERHLLLILCRPFHATFMAKPSRSVCCPHMEHTIRDAAAATTTSSTGGHRSSLERVLDGSASSRTKCAGGGSACRSSLERWRRSLESAVGDLGKSRRGPGP